ncbi:hypothetical protein JCM16303_006073 [Sporobolomyces ruberrimus]
MDGADAVEEECVEMKCAEGQSSADLGREGATAGSISSEVQFVGQVLDGGHQMEDGGVREKDGCTLETQGLSSSKEDLQLDVPLPPSPPKDLPLPLRLEDPNPTPKLRIAATRSSTPILSEGFPLNLFTDFVSDLTQRNFHSPDHPSSSSSKTFEVCWIWWDSHVSKPEDVEATIPFLLNWATSQTCTATGLRPGAFKLNLTIAFGSGNTLHSRLPIHSNLPLDTSFDFFMDEYLPRADFVFAIGARALGYNLDGLYREVLPLFSPTCRLFVTRARGILPPLELDPGLLGSHSRQKLIDMGALPNDNGTMVSALPLLSLALNLGTTVEYVEGVPNPEQAIVNDAARCYVGRALQSFGKKMSNIGGEANRFPHLFTMDQPLYAITPGGVAVQLKPRGFVLDRPILGDGPLPESQSIKRRVPSSQRDAMKLLHKVPDLDRNLTCSVPGCSLPWTSRQHKLCDDHLVTSNPPVPAPSKKRKGALPSDILEEEERPEKKSKLNDGARKKHVEKHVVDAQGRIVPPWEDSHSGVSTSSATPRPFEVFNDPSPQPSTSQVPMSAPAGHALLEKDGGRNGSHARAVSKPYKKKVIAPLSDEEDME